MGEDDPDSFERWMGRQDRKTSIAVVIVILFAANGLLTLLDRISPCKASENCYSTDGEMP